MAEVKIKYDPQVDILRLRLGEKPIEDSVQFDQGIIIDYDEDGNIVGFELLDASQIVNRTGVTAETGSTGS